MPWRRQARREVTSGRIRQVGEDTRFNLVTREAAQIQPTPKPGPL